MDKSCGLGVLSSNDGGNKVGLVNQVGEEKSFGLGVLSSNDGVLSTKWERATIQWSASLADRARSVRSRGLIIEASETRLRIWAMGRRDRSREPRKAAS